MYCCIFVQTPAHAVSFIVCLFSVDLYINCLSQVSAVLPIALTTPSQACCKYADTSNFQKTPVQFITKKKKNEIEWFKCDTLEG